MAKLQFRSGQELSDFLIKNGFFAIYFCDTECSSFEIDIYGLLKDGATIPVDCTPDKLFHLNGEAAIQILERYLKVGNVRIFPTTFTI